MQLWLIAGLREAVDEYIVSRGIQPINSRPPHDHTVYNGFVGVGDLRFFQSKEYLDFADFLNNEKKGVFTSRWSDQQIYPIALALFKPESAVQIWQMKAASGDNYTGYPIATHIHGRFFLNVKKKMDAFYAAALAEHSRPQSIEQERLEPGAESALPDSYSENMTMTTPMASILGMGGLLLICVVAVLSRNCSSIRNCRSMRSVPRQRSRNLTRHNWEKNGRRRFAAPSVLLQLTCGVVVFTALSSLGTLLAVWSNNNILMGGDVTAMLTYRDLFHWNTGRDPDAEELFQSIVTTQNPTHCKDAKFLVFRYRKVGMGSEMHSMSVALSYATRTGRILLVDKRSWPEMHEGCPKNSHSCFFAPLSGCKVSQEVMDAAPVMKDPKLEVLSTIPVLAFQLNTVKYMWIPTEYSAHSKSLVWYRANLLRYLARPSPAMVEAVRDQRVRMGIEDGRKCVAVHIRRTDGSQTGVRPLSTRTVLDALNSPMNSSLDRLFIVTDEIGFARALQQEYSGHLKVSFLDDSFHSNEDSRNKIITYRDGSRNPQPDYFSAAVDLFVAAGCDFFIGQFSSNFSRLIYELMYARMGERAERQVRSLDKDYFVNP